MLLRLTRIYRYIKLGYIEKGTTTRINGVGRSTHLKHKLFKVVSPFTRITVRGEANHLVTYRVQVVVAVFELLFVPLDFLLEHLDLLV